ncbi:uncharacterized protein [Salminus brasiliensis]|uniref:uncharacterized protein n=1 Tax=Salminus brasiliensis TaxID=930266 RepID=UPI003B82F41C
MALNCFMFLTVWMYLVLPCVCAETGCRNELISSINITSELQSDVLLPCNFEPTLLGSDKTADIAAVWSQKTIPVDNLIEIRLQCEVRFWTNRNGRIKPFLKLSASGNFSILLHNVSESDLGLYHCGLFKGMNCSIAYQEVYLNSRERMVADAFPTLLITAGALGGGIVLLSLLIIYWLCAKRSKNTGEETCEEIVHDTLNPTNSKCTSVKYTLENPIYDALIQTETNCWTKQEKEITSPDVAVYAIVKKGKRAPTERNQMEQAL